jgi:hypothetical protein
MSITTSSSEHPIQVGIFFLILFCTGGNGLREARYLASLSPFPHVQNRIKKKIPTCIGCSDEDVVIDIKQ